jgi:hypothetical protein
VDFTEDLLLIRNGRTSEPGSMSAYATDTLEFRWRTPVPRDGAARGRCFGLACGTDPSGIAVLDPGTGRTVWRAGPGLSLTRRGDVAVEVGADLERQMRVREVATGAVRTELPSWDTVVNQDGTAPIVLRRREGDRGLTAFGVLRPDGSAVQPLGLAGELVDDCLADERFVVCRTAAGAEVWSYRA